MSSLARLPASRFKADTLAPERTEREDEIFRLRFRCAALEKQLELAAETHRLLKRSQEENEDLEQKLRAAFQERAKLADLLGRIAASCRDLSAS